MAGLLGNLRPIKALHEGMEQSARVMGTPMARIRLMPLIAFWLCMAGAVGAQPLNVSIHPGKPSGSDSEKAGSLFMAMCLDHFMHGKLDWAEQACSQAVEADPHLADAYKLRAYVRLIGHRFERASDDFRAALQLKPKDDQNIAGYGQSLSGLGHFSDAVAQFRKALSLAPQRAAYWNGLCWALAGEGRQLPAALDACNRALSLAPGAAGILNSRAMVYLRQRRFPLAIADYAVSLEVQSDQASAWFGRGLARLFLGEKQGLLDIAEARRRDPGVDALFVQMGVLPSRCLKAEGPACPPGFPSRPEEPPGAYQVARLHADADQQLFLALQTDHDTAVTVRSRPRL
jgi:tetratricopeptide (TPR) repeat protein